MATVVQVNHLANSNTNTVAMNSFQSLHQPRDSTSSTPPRSSSPIHNREDSFRRMIFDKIEEGKRNNDPQKCTKILEDLMKMLKHLTADVNNYNLAFRETRPAFYMQEFQRLTDRIDILTNARDALSEYLREISDQSSRTTVPSSSFHSEISELTNSLLLQSSSEQSSDNLKSSNGRDRIQTDYSSLTDQTIPQHSYSLTFPLTALTPLQQAQLQNARATCPTKTPNNFIRVHFPNKHTTALAPRNDETLEVALASRASRHSVTNLRAYNPVYMISRQPCPWDITLDRVAETEIELEEKTKLDHSFEDIPTSRFTVFGVRCVVCRHRVREAHKRCVSCGNNYHNNCYTKAPVCSHSILQHIKHVPNRFDVNQVLITTKSKEQSLSLPRTTFSRPSVTLNYDLAGNGPSAISAETTRPNSIKSTHDSTNDVRKPVYKHVSEWEIRPEDLLNHGRMVGRGTYGTVYKAEVRLHGLVALKELNFISPTQSQFQAFRNEVIALKKITHQNTLNFYGYIISPRFAIVTQWCEGSTLYKHIHVLDRHWKINQLIDIARQICQGMSYLHDRGIIHRDLKSSNVFLDMCAETDDVGVGWRVKIGDFGLATVKTVLAESINQPFQPSGSVLWMSPEVIQQKDPSCYSTKADVYAYGCVLFEMFSGQLPHSPISNKEQIMWLVGKGRLKLKIEQCRDDTPAAITSLIRQCTEFDHEKRPNFAPEIDDTLSKFECILPRLQRSQSEPCLFHTHQDDLLDLSIHYDVPKTPVSIHRRFNAEVS